MAAAQGPVCTRGESPLSRHRKTRSAESARAGALVFWRKSSSIPWIVPAYDSAPIVAGSLRVASTTQHDLALSGFSFAPGDLPCRERFFLLRAYLHRGFRCDRTLLAAQELAD